MNQVLVGQLNEILDKTESLPALNCESQLRVAAAMLRHAEIGDESGLDTDVRLHVGSYAVRFSRRAGRS